MFPGPLGFEERRQRKTMTVVARYVVRIVDVLLSTIGWLFVAFLLVVAALRIFAWDDVGPFAFIDALNGLAYLPAVLVLLLAALRRRYRLVVASLLVVVAMVAFALPELLATKALPQWTAHATRFTIFDGNVDDANMSMSGYAKEIEQLHPDLVTFEEATTFDGMQLRDDGALSSLPYRFEVYRFDPWAFVIASRYRLSDMTVHKGGGLPFLVQGVLDLPSGPISLWVVHTLAPVSSLSTWRHDLETIANDYRREHPARLLVVGDFNATWGNSGFHEIVSTGLTDGAAAKGKPYDMTWSQLSGIVPPLIRIDHVLTGPGLATLTITTKDGPGSDHRALFATIAVRARS